MKKPDQNLDEDFTANNILKLEIKELKAVYERSIATRDFEIQQLQNRNNYFIIFQGVMLSGLITASASKPYVEFLICLFCIFFSMYQTHIAAGAKYWQEYWELKTSEFEGKLKKKFDEYMGIYKSELIRKIETQIDYLNRMGKYDGKIENIYDEKIENLYAEIEKIRKGRYVFYHLFEFLDDTDPEKTQFEQRLKKRIRKSEFYTESKNYNSVDYFDLITNNLILKKISVSRIPIVVGIFFTVLWLGLFVHTIGTSNKFFIVKGFNIEPNTHSIVDAGELPKSESDRAKANIIKLKNVEE
jgi:hypothetical protein